MLPCPYFHITVTVPEELRQALRDNQKDGYALLMKAAAEAIIPTCTASSPVAAFLSVIPLAGIRHVPPTWPPRDAIVSCLHALLPSCRKSPPAIPHSSAAPCSSPRAVHIGVPPNTSSPMRAGEISVRPPNNAPLTRVGPTGPLRRLRGAKTLDSLRFRRRNDSRDGGCNGDAEDTKRSHANDVVPLGEALTATE
jgi:hypothetical protein